MRSFGVGLPDQAKQDEPLQKVLSDSTGNRSSVVSPTILERIIVWFTVKLSGVRFRKVEIVSKVR
jgi:hypothetical protein